MPFIEAPTTFYMGRRYDPISQRLMEDVVYYDSRDLTTHAVCVGMTGSGKTGLCIALLEEAAIDGIPAIIVDPKGDIANLMLTFPELDAASFRPWINADDARRKGMTEDEYAANRADLWRNGLAQWGQDGERIRKLRESAEFGVYTPGSTAGVPLSILKALDAPPEGYALANPADAKAAMAELLAGADSVLAAGGGSTIGLGKALALRADITQIALPTTYAGSECTPILGQTENGALE